MEKSESKRDDFRYSCAVCGTAISFSSSINHGGYCNACISKWGEPEDAPTEFDFKDVLRFSFFVIVGVLLINLFYHLSLCFEFTL